MASEDLSVAQASALRSVRVLLDQAFGEVEGIWEGNTIGFTVQMPSERPRLSLVKDAA